jgi:hypothetical protein
MDKAAAKGRKQAYEAPRMSSYSAEEIQAALGPAVAVYP